MPTLPAEIILFLAPFVPLFSERVWLHAHVRLWGAMLAPGVRTVTAALRVMGLATERHFTHDHRVLNRATWSARQGSQILLGVLIPLRVPAGRPSCSGQTTPWNAAADARSPPKAAIVMRCAPAKRT